MSEIDAKTFILDQKRQLNLSYDLVRRLKDYSKQLNRIDQIIKYKQKNGYDLALCEIKKKIITDTYKEIANIICKYYGNSEDSCRTTINNIKSDSQGIRFISDANNSYVYIDINKSVDVTNVFNSAYTEETKVTLDNTNYSLKISDTEISNITVTNSDTDIKVSGSIKNLSTEGTLSIIVKLYDNDGNVVGEDKKAYTADKALNGEDTFEFSFAYNDILKNDNVKDYSIIVVS